MFRQFHRPAFAIAWADTGCGNQFFAHGRGRHGRGWGDEQRTRRGDIKFILLELLAERPRHGYELIKDLEARHGGFRRLSPGSVYPTLQLLEDGGYLTSEQVEGKRVYTVTESGQQLLSDRNQQAGSPDEAYSNPGMPAELLELRKAFIELNDAITQLARSGNLEQASQIRESLIQVKREIYRLLAD
ncbi:MAG: PadR family transcriptional regulator [Aphanocapsa sp. GSE-SYN-MK-11-07L]|jgi:DNA-binding PadR family transcriptional regulator|nr:PadR family transcriptional regulator [Aphanocapsa sp. GSE-SYN-MK-11-07L]